jgi:hypothetical protein
LTASATDLPRRRKKKLQVLIKDLNAELPVAARGGKKSAHRHLERLLKAIERTVMRARKKVSVGTFNELNAALARVAEAIDGL